MNAPDLVLLDFPFWSFHSQGLSRAKKSESILSKDWGHILGSNWSWDSLCLEVLDSLMSVFTDCKGQVQSGSSLPVHKVLLSSFAPSSSLNKGHHPHDAARLQGVTPISKTGNWEKRGKSEFLN